MSLDAIESPGKQISVDEFPVLADQWYNDTAHLSFVYKIVRHPAYQRIIGMGRPALPLILKELRDRPHHWFTALEIITGENPVPTGANPLEARAAWLQWGSQHGYLV
jgi:hypothetical protein